MSLLKYILKENILPIELRRKNILYHATNIFNIQNILKTNVLYGSNMYDFGIATSRNKDYLFKLGDDGTPYKGEADGQLLLDRDKISNRYKIIPFDWEEFKFKGIEKNQPEYIQMEDKILTSSIKDIDKYIIGLQFNKTPNRFYRYVKEFIKDDWIIFDNRWEIIETE